MVSEVKLSCYFSDHMQYTNISDSSSNVLSVKYRIVQGSTLVPLMFQVYNNDIEESSRLLNFSSYVDDASICLPGYDLINFSIH